MQVLVVWVHGIDVSARVVCQCLSCRWRIFHDIKRIRLPDSEQNIASPLVPLLVYLVTGIPEEALPVCISMVFQSVGTETFWIASGRAGNGRWLAFVSTACAKRIKCTNCLSHLDPPKILLVMWPAQYVFTKPRRAVGWTMIFSCLSLFNFSSCQETQKREERSFVVPSAPEWSTVVKTSVEALNCYHSPSP